MNPLIFQAIFGLFALVGICWLISENRRRVSFKMIAGGLTVQAIFALLILKVPAIEWVFKKISEGVGCLKDAALEGTKFVFGYVGGADVPFVLNPEAMAKGATPFVFAFQPLAMIMVVSALAMLLFHWGILPIMVRGFSKVLKKTMNIGGALGVCSAAKIFLGQTDAPLLIRPYLAKFSRSELFTVMVAGMATTSASIIALYASILEGTMSNPIQHILTASVISIPAAITLSRVIVPHEGEHTSGDLVLPYKFSGAMDAVAQGATDGMKLFLSIIAMIVVALALVALADMILDAALPGFGGEAITLKRIFGYVMAPVAWLMGIPWSEATIAGGILGTKTALNELVAFITLANTPQDSLSDHSNVIMTYALCGFANLSSIGIQIGGLGAMVPERRTEIISLGFKALIAGTLASCMSGTLAGILWWWN